MATRRQYGTTWWGAAWLAALEKVDDANRLPRGKSYANTGRVEQFSLAADRPGCVEAFVSGSVYYPYEVTVGMKPISARDAKRLTAAIAADPDWSVRRAFTAQIIINHVQARDGEKIDNMDQALERAVANGVKNLVVQPTHLMHGAEYDEMCEAVEQYRDKFDSVAIAEPLLGEVGEDASVINADKEAVAAAITAEAVKTAGYDDAAAAAADGTAFVFMGHGTSHTAKVSYSQMQTTMETLGYDNVFIGTVEGEPEDTACDAVIEKVKEAGYTKVILRPLMVVAGDHANNDMAGAEDDSWLSQFQASGDFASVECQIAGLGEIKDIQQRYIEHTKAAIDSLNG